MTEITELKKPFAKLNQFGKSYGVPIIAGVSGFVAGDIFQLGPILSSRIGARQVSVVGFKFDVTAWSVIFIYSAIAFGVSTMVSKVSSMVGRAVFAFFIGSVLKQLVDMFGITQDILVVS